MALAQMGHPTLCFDCDIGLRNLDIALSMTDRAVMDFTDVLSNCCTLDEAVAPHPKQKNLYLLTAPTRLHGTEIDMEKLRALFDEIREKFDYCLVDAPAGLDAGFHMASTTCDRAIVVTTTDPTALRDAQRTVAELEGIRQVHLVMNRIQPKLLRKLRTTIDDAMNAAGLPLAGVVPEDPQVILCANQGIPLASQRRRGATLACWNIAQRLEGNQIPIMRIR